MSMSPLPAEYFSEHGFVVHTRYFEQTFVANATVVVRPFTVFLEVVRHVGSSQELATNLAGDFVLVTCEM